MTHRRRNLKGHGGASRDQYELVWQTRGGSGYRRGVVVFCEGDHEALLRRYEELVPAGKWPAWEGDAA